MTRSVLVAILVAGSASAASAGTYVGLGVGNSSVSDSSNNTYLPDGRSGRLMLGMRFANVSIEGAGTSYGVIFNKSNADSRSLSGSLKLSIPLGNNFEAFGRAGLLRTWLTPQASQSMTTFSGDGYTASAGFEYRLNLGLAGGSLFVDYTRNSATLTGTTGAQLADQTASMWTLGLLLAI